MLKVYSKQNSTIYSLGCRDLQVTDSCMYLLPLNSKDYHIVVPQGLLLGLATNQRLFLIRIKYDSVFPNINDVVFTSRLGKLNKEI